MTLYKELVQDPRITVRIKIRTYINYWRFSFFNDKRFKENWANINYNLIGLLVFPFGTIARLNDDVNAKVKI
jgi:hypothetical protein